jgi:hypothetical protein
MDFTFPAPPDARGQFRRQKLLSVAATASVRMADMRMV